MTKDTMSITSPCLFLKIGEEDFKKIGFIQEDPENPVKELLVITDFNKKETKHERILPDVLFCIAYDKTKKGKNGFRQLFHPKSRIECLFKAFFDERDRHNFESINLYLQDLGHFNQCIIKQFDYDKKTNELEQEFDCANQLECMKHFLKYVFKDAEEKR